MNRGSIFFIDDEPDIVESAREWLTLSGFEVDAAADGNAAMATLENRRFDVVVTDVRMPGMDGLELLQAIRQRDPAQVVILLTGHGDVPLAVEAMRLGAHDFLEKPYDADHLVVVLDRAVSTRRLAEEVQRFRSTVDGMADLEARLVGATPAMTALRARIGQLSNLDVDILICGETGSGKEIVARALHDLGKRRNKPFVALNCAAIPESVFESEMFGYDRGAFTGALQKRTGKIEHAHGGTVFLDEIETMPLPLQAKLLRVIQERIVEPLGGNRQIPVDVRFIAATKADLGKPSGTVQFRPDLYFRLATVGVTIPPLRARRGDVPLLFRHFCAEAAARHGTPPRRPDPGLFAVLEAREWPGNVRELKAVAERFALGLPLDGQSLSDTGSHNMPLTERVAAFEARLIREALQACDGSSKVASDILGVPLRTLNEKIQRYGIRGRQG
jgi:two-component system C4-dicarboxylate transport response regulator DctD